jgi:hypothetical protein
VAINLGVAERGIYIYPSPATTQIKILVEQSSLINTEALLLDPEGQLLQRIKFVNREENINIANLPAGTYFLKTVDGKAYKIIKL